MRIVIRCVGSLLKERTTHLRQLRPPVTSRVFAQQVTTVAMHPNENILVLDDSPEVLELLVSGHSNKAVASKLVVSEDTVKTHIRGLYRKLGVSDRSGAIAVALREGLVEPE